MNPDMINCMILPIHVEKKFLATPSGGKLVEEHEMGVKEMLGLCLWFLPSCN